MTASIQLCLSEIDCRIKNYFSFGEGQWLTMSVMVHWGTEFEEILRCSQPPPAVASQKTIPPHQNPSWQTSCTYQNLLFWCSNLCKTNLPVTVHSIFPSKLEVKIKFQPFIIASISPPLQPWTLSNLTVRPLKILQNSPVETIFFKKGSVNPEPVNI